VRVKRWPALARIRIGCVRYLNARPLIHAYDGPVQCEHPAELAVALERGNIDAGLVPVVELFGSRRYLVVDDVAIASNGPVFSVILAHKGPVQRIAAIVADPASRTSIALIRILLAELHGITPEFVAHDAAAGSHAARLLIGNQALAFRSHAHEYHLLDLGEEWTRLTGLPFVYAAWLLRPQLPHVGAIAREFRALKECGLAALNEIIEAETEFPRELCARYLREHIRFHLGPREKEGLARFGELLRQHKLAPLSMEAPRFV
jgi:predicted solute-binding protein